MDVGGISSYTDFLAGQSQNVAGTKLKDTIKSTDYTKAEDDELLDACKQFEEYFLEQVFKEMQKTVDAVKDENSLDTSNSMIDYFQDMTIQSLASTSTELQGLGLAQTLYEQMKRNYGIE